MYDAKLAQKGTDRLTQKPLSGPSLTSLIRVYLDGRQLSDVVTRYQRRSDRSIGG